MTQLNLKRLLFFLLTLPLGIFICRGRTIPMPHASISPASIVSERLSLHSSRQAKRHDLPGIERDEHRLPHLQPGSRGSNA